MEQQEPKLFWKTITDIINLVGVMKPDAYRYEENEHNRLLMLIENMPGSITESDITSIIRQNFLINVIDTLNANERDTGDEDDVEGYYVFEIVDSGTRSSHYFQLPLLYSSWEGIMPYWDKIHEVIRDVQTRKSWRRKI